jgi:hypothetical protein
MSDLIRDGAAFLADALRSSAGTAVVYSRGASSQTVIATIGKSIFESQDASGVVETWESRDFIVRLSDLPFGEPQRNDRITETIGGSSIVYAVSAPRGVPLFHYADAFGQSAKIHAKRID